MKLKVYETMFAVTLISVSLFSLLLLLGFSHKPVQAAVPKLINFQGKLTSVSNGSNVPNGTYAFEFKLYDAATSGTLLWTETFDQASGNCQKVLVTNGVFNVKLGSCADLSSVDLSGGSVFLSVNFAPTGTSYDGEMSPRKQLLSSAFALVANGVSGDGAVNNATQSATALTTGRTGANPALQVDTNTASSVTGLKVTSAAAAGGIALTAISSGTNENLTLDAKGSGSVSINGSATGDILLGGGSGSTGCTLTNSTGAFACTGAVTGSNLSGINTGDQIITLTGDVTGTGTSSFATSITSQTSATWAGKVSDETGTGAWVFGTSPTIATPTFATSAISPLLIGGTGTTSTLILRSTSGVGTTGADIVFQTGNNGATEVMRILNNGNVGIRNTNPQYNLDIGDFATSSQTLRLAATTNTSSSIRLMEQSDSFGFSLNYDGASSNNFEILRHDNNAVGTQVLSVSRSTGVVSFASGLSIPNITSPGDLNITPAAGSHLNVNLSGTGDFIVNTDDLYVDTSSGYVGIGATSINSMLQIGTDAVIQQWSSTTVPQVLITGADNEAQAIAFRIQDENQQEWLRVQAAGTGAADRGIVSVFGQLGLGTASPSARLHSIATTEQLRVGYDVSNYYSTTVGSTGIVTFDAVGSGSSFVFSDRISSPGSGGSLGERFGAGSDAAGNGSIAFGNGAYSLGVNSVALGRNSSTDATGTQVAIGSSANATGDVAIGGSSTVAGAGSIGIGLSISVAGVNSLGIGRSANVSHNSSIAIGREAATTAINQLVVGSSNYSISDIFFGKGVTNATPTAYTINGTGGSGTNIAGAAINIAGGRGTGTGVGGNIVFQYAPAGSTGATANALQTACIISGANGSLSCPGTGTNSERFGAGAVASNNSTLALGNGAQATGDGSIAIGVGVLSASSTSLAIGNSITINTGSANIAFGNGASITSSSNNIAIGPLASAGGNSTVALGQNSTATANNSTALGQGTSSTFVQGVALGQGSATTASNQLVAGSSTSPINNLFFGKGVTNATPTAYTINGTGGSGTNIAGAAINIAGGAGTGTGVGGNIVFQYAPSGSSGSTLNTLQTACVILGADGSLSCLGTVAGNERFGSGSSATGSNGFATAIGYGAVASGNSSTALGRGSLATSNNSIAIGVDSNTIGGSGSIAIGVSSLSIANATTALGYATTASGAQSTAIGYSAVANGANSIALGVETSTDGFTNSIVIGRAATSTASSQFVSGSSSYPINDIFFGKGVANATPTAYTINGTGGSGTNIAGADIILGAGKGTGSAQSGDILFQTSTAGVSGATLQTLATRMTIDGLNGNVGIGDTSPASLLTVGSGDLFQVNSSGAIAVAAGITSSGTITFSGLGGGGTQCVNVNNSGVLGVTTCGGALTPWTSDIDADGFDLQDLSNLEFRDTTGAPAGTVAAIFRDNTGDLNINALSTKTVNLLVAGTDEYNFSSTTLNMNSNTITNVGSFNGLVVTANTGLITSGTWQGSVLGATYGGTGINNGSNTITLGGNISTAGSFATSGAFALTLTQTGATNVTLPTTGTLATLSGTETLSGKTLTAPRIVNGDFIADANGNEQIIFNTTASAVNELTVTNAATAGVVALAVTGGDTDVELSLNSKGADNLSLNGTATGNILLGGGSGSTGCTVTNATGAFACTAGGSFTTLGLAGAITGATGITSSGTIQFSALTSNGPLYTSGGNGTLTTTAPTSGAIGYWSRTGTTLSQTIANDLLSLTGNTGDLLSVASSATGSANKAINISQTGATTGTDYAGYFSNTGAATTNVGLYATATGGTNNYAAIFEAGNVGIGTITPTGTLHVVGQSVASVGSGNGNNAVAVFNVVGAAGGNTSANSGSVFGGIGSAINVTSGDGGSTTGTPGTGFGGTGGGISFTAGAGGTGTTFGGVGGDINLLGGSGGFGPSNGAAGYVAIKGGNGFASGNSSGGNVFLVGGIPNGSGTAGNIYLGVSPSFTTRGGVAVGLTSSPVSLLDVAGGISVGTYAGVTAAPTNGMIISDNVGIGTSGPDRKLDVLDATNPQVRLTTTDGTVYSDLQNTANANVIVTGNTLASSSTFQIGVQIAPVINQTASAHYRALDVNVTETAATTLNGLNRLADFRVGGSSKLAVRNDGSLLLQNAANVVTPFGSLGRFQNILVQSENFTTTWTTNNISAITANGQTAPDGSTTAERLTTSSSGGYVQQDTSTAVSATTYTFSVWVKSSSGTQTFDMRIDGTTTGTGTVATHTATTSWQRFSVTQDVTTFTGNVRVRLFPGGTAGSGTIDAWGAQLEQSATSNAYAYTTTGALTNVNRGETAVSNFATQSGFTYGGRKIINLEGAISASSTTVGQMIRVNDNATGTDDTATVRALEVQSFSGSNINGVNTAIAGFGYTFGVHAVSTGQANEAAQPAAVFADLDNGSAPTQGNAIRAYSNNLTSADLVSFYHEASAFTGNGLEMNFGNSAGSFTGNFISLQKAGTESFHVDDDGSTFVSFTGGATSHAVCHATNGNVNNDELVDCTGTPSADFSEMYPVVNGAEVGDIVVTGKEMVNTYDMLANGDGVNWSDVKGQITKLEKSNRSYQSNIVGIVSDNYADFTSTGYNIKEQDNPKSIALKGRVLVNVTDENGPIKAGDYITASSLINGYGTRATRSGQVVGQALADINFENNSTGQIMVFVQVGYQSIGNTIVLDAPSSTGIDLQNGGTNLTGNTASTFVIQQQTSNGEQDDQPESNILQLQTGDANRFMVSSTGATSILSNLNCEVDAESCPSVLKVTQANTELMNIDARGTLSLAGTIIIKDDTFAGSVATNEDGLAEITFSYNLGTGKPVVQLTAEAQIPVFAQILEFKQDENGNYTGFVMKTFDLVSGPIQAIVHYNVVGKQADYITLGEVVVSDEELEIFSDGGNSNDGVGLIIDGGEVVGGGVDEGSEVSGETVSGDFTSNNQGGNITTEANSDTDPSSETNPVE